jgi:hypothetical protein
MESLCFIGSCLYRAQNICVESFTAVACFRPKTDEHWGYLVMRTQNLLENKTIKWREETVNVIKIYNLIGKYSRVSFNDGVTFSNIWL